MSNENQRETKEVTVGKHKLVVHTYITGREARDIEGALMDKIQMSQRVGEGAEIKGLTGIQLKERQDLQVKAVVVSINGKTDNVLDIILDLPNTESEKIMETIAEIAEPKKEIAGN